MLKFQRSRRRRRPAGLRGRLAPSAARNAAAAKEPPRSISRPLRRRFATETAVDVASRPGEGATGRNGAGLRREPGDAQGGDAAERRVKPFHFQQRRHVSPLRRRKLIILIFVHQDRTKVKHRRRRPSQARATAGRGSTPLQSAATRASGDGCGSAAKAAPALRQGPAGRRAGGAKAFSTLEAHPATSARWPAHDRRRASIDQDRRRRTVGTAKLDDAGGRAPPRAAARPPALDGNPRLDCRPPASSARQNATKGAPPFTPVRSPVAPARKRRERLAPVAARGSQRRGGGGAFGDAETIVGKEGRRRARSCGLAVPLHRRTQIGDRRRRPAFSKTGRLVRPRSPLDAAPGARRARGASL